MDYGGEMRDEQRNVKSMKKAIMLLLPLIGAGVCLSCGNKNNQQEEIIVEKIVEKPSDEVKSAVRSAQEGSVRWVEGNEYSYKIAYETIDSLPAVESYGEKYRENAVTITVNRGDGSEMCSKKVLKSSFSGLLSDEMKAHGILVSVVFDRSDNDNLHFVASVGSPDETNEDFVLFQYSVNRFGETSVAKYIPREKLGE